MKALRVHAGVCRSAHAPLGGGTACFHWGLNDTDPNHVETMVEISGARLDVSGHHSGLIPQCFPPGDLQFGLRGESPAFLLRF